MIVWKLVEQSGAERSRAANGAPLRVNVEVEESLIIISRVDKGMIYLYPASKMRN